MARGSTPRDDRRAPPFAKRRRAVPLADLIGDALTPAARASSRAVWAGPSASTPMTRWRAAVMRSGGGPSSTKPLRGAGGSNADGTLMAMRSTEPRSEQV